MTIFILNQWESIHAAVDYDGVHKYMAWLLVALVLRD
jgi:hypothetical protein